MFELVDSQPSHLISTDVLNLTPGNLLYCLFTDSKLLRFTFINTHHVIVPQQTFQIQTGSSASLILRMKNLKSCLCEEQLHLPDFQSSVVEPPQRKEKNTIDVQGHCGIVTCVKHTAFFLNSYTDCSLSP